MDKEGLKELLHQALVTEEGGVKVYETALQCAVDKDLRKEWSKYLEQTRKHVTILEDVFHKLGLDPKKLTPGAKVVKLKGESLVAAMKKARSGGSKEAAQLAAAECVIDAESKDHMNWELIGEVVKAAEPELTGALQAAFEEVEPEEDEHLYHTKGWARELWLDFIGLPAALPPPEEVLDARSQTEAARAKGQRGRMAGRKSGRRRGIVQRLRQKI